MCSPSVDLNCYPSDGTCIGRPTLQGLARSSLHESPSDCDEIMRSVMRGDGLKLSQNAKKKKTNLLR